MSMQLNVNDLDRKSVKFGSRFNLKNTFTAIYIDHKIEQTIASAHIHAKKKHACYMDMER